MGGTGAERTQDGTGNVSHPVCHRGCLHRPWDGELTSLPVESELYDLLCLAWSSLSHVVFGD